MLADNTRIPIPVGEFHELTVSWDYRSPVGRKTVTLDQIELFGLPMNFKTGFSDVRYIWLNGGLRGDELVNGSFEGCIDYIRFYPTVISAEKAASQGKHTTLRIATSQKT